MDSDGGSLDNSEELEQVKQLEKQAVRVAESGNLMDALHLLNKAVSQMPSYASAHNNRAQVSFLM